VVISTLPPPPTYFLTLCLFARGLDNAGKTTVTKKFNGEV